MKIYSEKTNKEYTTVEECLQAEKEFDEAVAKEKAEKERKLAEEQAKHKALTEARKSRANEVEEAYKAVIEAQKHYHELLQAFCKDYGAFHMTLHTGEGNPFDAFNHLFDFWL